MNPVKKLSTLGLPSLALVAAILAGAAVAEPPDEAIWQTLFRGSTEVNVVNVEVVVTDRQGNPVAGLAAGDFELLENGKPVEITNFYAAEDGRTLTLGSVDGAVAADATAAPPTANANAANAADDAETAVKPLHLILYVDNANIAEINRRRVFERLKQHVLESWRPEMRVMVVSNDRSLTIRQDFTQVPHELFVTLSEIEKTASQTPRFDLQQREIARAIEAVNVEAGSGLFATKNAGSGGIANTGEGNRTEDRGQAAITDLVSDQARALLPQIRAFSEQRLHHVHETVRTLGQLVDMAAGLEGRKAVFYVSDGLSLRPGAALFEAWGKRFDQLDGLGANVSPEAEASRDDASREFRDLISRAGSSRVTFYTLQASNSASLDRGSAATTGSAGGNFATWNDSFDSTDDRYLQDSLVMMAQGTGGRHGFGPTAFAAVFDGIVEDFDNYYSLGYAGDRLPAGAERQIKVRLPGRKDLRVRHRQTFRDTTIAERAAAQTRAALVLDSPVNPLGVALEAHPAEPGEGNLMVVPLLVKVPLGQIVLTPGKSEHQGQVSMFVAVRDERGRTSEVNRHLCPIRIANDEVLTALGQSAACGVRLLMRQGPQRIAVSVLDEAAATHSTTHLELDVGTRVSQTGVAGEGP